MPNSDRTLIVEVTVAIAIVVSGIGLASSGDLSVPTADVHPLWIPVLLFAARYGMRGLFTAVALSALALATLSLAEHGTLADLAARGTSVYDMMALVAATLVAWTAGMRDGRLSHALVSRDELARRLRKSEETASAMSEVVTVLRERLDRLDMSISMWRTIAGRLDSGRLPEAATAALELAGIRSGGIAGMVQRCVGNRLQTIATFGNVADRKNDITRDRTVQSAVASGRPALRREVTGATDEDSEIAVPITSPDTGDILGVLAMRDVTPGQLHTAQVRDLELVAGWLADAFPRPQLRAGQHAC